MEHRSLFGTGHGIGDFDGDNVTQIGFDCGAGKLAVDEEVILLVAIRCYCASRKCEVAESPLI